MSARMNEEILAIWNRAEYLYRNGVDSDASRQEYAELCKILIEHDWGTPEDLDAAIAYAGAKTAGWGPEEWAKYEEMINLEILDR